MGRFKAFIFLTAICSVSAAAWAQSPGGFGDASGYGQGYTQTYGQPPYGQGNRPGYFPIYGSPSAQPVSPVSAIGDRRDYANNDVVTPDNRARGTPAYPDGLVDPAAGLPPGPTITPPTPTLAAFSTTAGTSFAPAIGQTGSGPTTFDGRILESSWYVGTEYLHWNERVAGSDFVNESGAFYTLGYMHRLGIERYRVELFGGDIHYSGATQGGSGPPDAISSNTGYLGLNTQYELMLSPPTWGEHNAVLVGVGSRFWIRDLHDGTSVSGYPYYGYDEIWWSLYPFLGLESSRPTASGWDLYSQVRCGPTCLTYQDVSINTRPLWPKCGVYAQGQVGLRDAHFFLEGYGEFMNWGQSSEVEGSFQPKSTMYGLGARTGVTF